MSEALGLLSGVLKWTPDGGAATEVPHAQSFSLNQSEAANEYSSSSTSGQVWRTAGPEDETGSVTVLIDDTTDISTILDVGDVGQFEQFASDGSTSFRASSAKTQILSVNVEVKLEDGSPAQATIEFARQSA